MPHRPQRLRTDVLIALRYPFSGSGVAMIFRATVNESQGRLVLFEDIGGVFNRIIELGLISPPETFASDKDQHSFWREVLERVEVEWDHADLRMGNQARLHYPGSDGALVPLCDWERIARLETVVKRSYVST